MIVLFIRGPPRPSPASVTYSEDLEGAKGPLPDSDDDGSSSTTEKPSNLGDSTEVRSETVKLKLIQ